MHSFLEQFYENFMLIFAQNLRTMKNSSLSSKNKLRTNEKAKKSKLIKET